MRRRRSLAEAEQLVRSVISPRSDAEGVLLATGLLAGLWALSGDDRQSSRRVAAWLG